ncbi:MAG: hypothetical protein OXT09_30855, partial [Myxococcales bacterium]|nr:hypothetical protein [Myxococcales bacterium]
MTAPDGMIGWWRGDDERGAIAGSADAVLEGAVDFEPGKGGEAFSFDGGWAEVAFDYSGPFSVDFWARSTAEQARFASVLATGFPGHYDRYFQLMADGDGNWALLAGEGADEIE